jgi:hypothetical protein
MALAGFLTPIALSHSHASLHHLGAQNTLMPPGVKIYAPSEV